MLVKQKSYLSLSYLIRATVVPYTFGTKAAQLATCADIEVLNGQ